MTGHLEDELNIWDEGYRSALHVLWWVHCWSRTTFFRYRRYSQELANILVITFILHIKSSFFLSILNVPST